jgi:hypothetical protein
MVDLSITDNPDHANYIKCMEEVKRRVRAIDDILQGTTTTSFQYTNAEFVALQFRKIFELIILATLASHKHLFEGLARKLAKEWQISKVIAIVEKRNPRFFPHPVRRVPSADPRLKDDLVDLNEGFLTQDELVAAHGKIGNLMHANSPYQETSVVAAFEKEFPVWRTKMMELLNNHIIRFPEEKAFLYIGMQSEETGSVHTALFGLTNLPEVAVARKSET